ncbi:MAG: PQQ-dependent catabolism-associated CXXCW motif protein [Methyloligellaceae bacterium]
MTARAQTANPGARTALALGFLLALTAPLPAGAGETHPDEPKGYRTHDYRTAVPATLEGATVVSDREALRLWKSGAVLFIDVMPRPPRPVGLPAGTLWRLKPRRNIPGSVWLPNVGFGVLNAQVEAYFKSNLAKLTGRDRSKPLLFYCLADCWMSWNAAKRALAYGYRRVTWYPEGTDGWVAAGGKLEASEPVPLQGGDLELR